MTWPATSLRSRGKGIGYVFARILGALCAFLIASGAQAKVLPEPPVMVKRDIAPSVKPPDGKSVTIKDGDVSFILFVPRGYRVPANGAVALRVHFHTATWFVIQEYLRAGHSEPLLVFNTGQSSAGFQQVFEDRERFGRWLSLVEGELRKQGANEQTRVSAVDISSFSAGYAAVRELLKSSEYFRLIRSIILCDSMYAGMEQQPAEGETPRLIREHLDPWLPFCREAVRGRKTFVFTHSGVPPMKSATGGTCAREIIHILDLPVYDVTPGSTPASSDQDHPLKTRTDAGNFHVWGYGGINGDAHLTHARHLGDIWMALDKADLANKPRWTSSDNGSLILRPFANAPYPYASRALGYDRDGKHYPADRHYSDSTIGIFIPAGFKPGPETDFVLYFHGHLNHVAKSIEDADLPGQIVKSGVNAILLVVQGPYESPDSDDGRLQHEPGAFAALMNEVAAFLKSEGRISTERIGRIVLSSHSGGYQVTSFILHHGGMNDHITDTLLLDSSYGALEWIAGWAAGGRSRRLVSIYTAHLAEENAELMALLDKAGCAYQNLEETQVTNDILRRRVPTFISTKTLRHWDVISKVDTLADWLRTSALEQRRKS